jgi:DNA-binding IclR family transcriptional regulator
MPDSVAAVPVDGIAFSAVKNKPHYSIESVDHALHLAQLLQQEGPLRVTDAAERLGVSRSTAHRLLSMLVYRDFAAQQEDRRYVAGPVLRPAEVSEAPLSTLRRLALPHLQRLVSRVRESANLMVLVGTEVRFIATVETDQVLRAGDREGRALPARVASGGKAMLAALPAEELSALFASEDVDLTKLRRELSLVRKRGFAINDRQTEAGLTAIGMAVQDADGRPTAAVSLAFPSARFDRDLLPTWVGAMSATVAMIQHELAAAA